MTAPALRDDGGRPLLQILREQLAPTATDDELAYFGQVCQRLDLDPFAGHIYLIPRWDARVGRVISRPQVSVEGRQVLAERSGLVAGIDGPYWCGPKRDDGTHTWVDVWDDDDPPHAARVFVYRKGWEAPANGTVRWKEFAQKDKHGNVLPLWEKMPSHMLGKVALSLGLRRAFPGMVPHGVDLEDAHFYADSPGAAENGEEPGVGPDDRLASAPGPTSDIDDVYAPELEPMRDDQRELIRALFREVGVVDDARHQLVAVSEILGRRITDIGQVSEADADRIVARLDELNEAP